MNINLKQAESYLDALAGESNGTFTFQTFCDDRKKKNPKLTRVLHGTFSEHSNTLFELNKNGAGIFVTVNQTDGKGRKKSNIIGLRALFVEKDNGVLPTLAIEPSIIVNSKNGPHAYWLLFPGEDLTRFELAQQALITHLRTDPVIKDLSRVLRIPGFLHQKNPADSFLVTIATLRPHRYHIDDILSAYPAPSESRRTENARREKKKDDLECRARKYLDKVPGAIEGQGGDKHTFTVACRLVRDFGLSTEQAIPLFEEWNKKCAPPWNSNELREKLDQAAKYARGEKGTFREEKDRQTPEADSSASEQDLVKHLRVLEGLAERAQEDPGILFDCEILESAVRLKRSYPAEWVRLHKKLKDSRVPLQEFIREIKNRIRDAVHEANSQSQYENEDGFFADSDSEQSDGQCRKGRSFKKYTVENGRITHNRQTPDGLISVPLCNFDASIEAEETRDDGVERVLVFGINGTLQYGEELPSLTVPASTFPSLNWTTQWGSRAIVFPGQGTRDNLRAAIQTLSGKTERRTVYIHLGWREIGGQWAYLHADGAIGCNQPVYVSPDEGNLGCFQLFSPPAGEELKRVVHSSMKLLTVAPKGIAIPLLSATYRAPLAEIAPIDVSLFLVGPTGNQKTELSVLSQAHYGSKFTRLNLPASWSSTENYLERQTFLAKDAVFVIDDFAPGNGQNDVNALHRKSERVFRAQGNGSGRGRMRSDGSLRKSNPPRCLIISTGEDIPRGHSLRARLNIAEVEPGSVNLNILTELQGHAVSGDLAKAMSAYIAYVAENFESLRRSIPILQTKYRAMASEESMHKRTPDSIASQMLGLEVFSDFCVAREVMSADEKTFFCESGFAELVQVGRAQSDYQTGEDPTQRFCELLRSALTSGNAHIADAKTGKWPADPQNWGWKEGDYNLSGVRISEWSSKGNKIGWLDGEQLLLDADASYTVLQKLSRDQGDQMPLTKHTLIKRLAQKGIALLPPGEKGKNVTKRTVEGERRSVIVIPDKTRIVQMETRDTGDSGDKAAPPE